MWPRCPRSVSKISMWPRCPRSVSKILMGPRCSQSVTKLKILPLQRFTFSPENLPWPGCPQSVVNQYNDRYKKGSKHHKKGIPLFKRYICDWQDLYLVHRRQIMPSNWLVQFFKILLEMQKKCMKPKKWFMKKLFNLIFLHQKLNFILQNFISQETLKARASSLEISI